MNESYTEKVRISRIDRVSLLNRNYQLVSYTVLDNPQLFSIVRSRSGVSLPDWRDKIRRGENATTPFSGVKRFIAPQNGDVTSFRPNGANFSQVRSTGPVGLEVPPEYNGSTTSADNQALRGIYRKIRETRTQFQGGVFLGEMRETIRMLKSPLVALRQGVTNYFSDLNKKVPRTKRKHLREAISGTWLEHSFGWKPFINDISEGLKAVRKLGERNSSLTLRSTGISEEFVNDWTSLAYSWAPDQPILADRYTINRVIVRYIVGMRLTTQALTTPEVFEHFGFVKSQLVPTLWELTPWSFLIDYFTNIGDMIDAGATNTSDVRWCCKTLIREKSYVYTSRINHAKFKQDFPLNSWIKGEPGQGSTLTRSVTRSSILSLPFPTLSVEVPLRPQQWLNMAALFGARKELLLRLNRD